MNDENLVSLADRTKDEQREIARMGGVRSGEVRREKKRLRECLEECLSMTTELDGEEVTNAEAIAAAMVRKAREGDVRAFVEVRNSVGEMPIARTQIEQTAIPQSTYDEIERLLMGDDEG